MNVGADRGRPEWYETDAGHLQEDTPARPTAHLLR